MLLGRAFQSLGGRNLSVSTTLEIDSGFEEDLMVAWLEY